jgi:hypothetical protein
MALLINKNVTVLGDIDLSQLYVRIILHNGPGSIPLFVETNVYSSKFSYSDDSENNNFYVEGLSIREQFNYDREINGVDILGYVHNALKTKFSTDITAEQPVLDPSTGEPTYDPSTGEPIMEEVIAIPKFCQDSSISFVDVSIG